MSGSECKPDRAQQHGHVKVGLIQGQTSKSPKFPTIETSNLGDLDVCP